MNLFRDDLGAYYAMAGADPDFEDGDIPFDAIGPDPDAESDPAIRDLETACAWCGREHSSTGMHADLQRVCDCKRHIDGGGGKYDCRAPHPFDLAR